MAICANANYDIARGKVPDNGTLIRASGFPLGEKRRTPVDCIGEVIKADTKMVRIRDTAGFQHEFGTAAVIRACSNFDKERFCNSEYFTSGSTNSN